MESETAEHETAEKGGLLYNFLQYRSTNEKYGQPLGRGFRVSASCHQVDGEWGSVKTSGAGKDLQDKQAVGWIWLLTNPCRKVLNKKKEEEE